MAVRTYRYRRQEAADPTKINARVPGTATLVTAAGGQVVDYSYEENNIADLDAVMSALGFTNIATDPTTPPQNDLAGVSIFGGAYEHSEALAEVSTTLDTPYQQAHKFTTASLVAGDYRVNISFEMKSSNANRAVAWRVQLDDTITVQENLEVLSDSYISFSKSVRVTFTAGIHEIDIDIRRVAAQAATASIRNMRVDLWVVS